MSTYKARVVTKQFKIETRQHDLFGLDLGEGPRRRDLALGLVVVPVWIGLMLLLFGAPQKWTMIFYMAPPLLFLQYGIQESATNPRRMNITVWLLAIRYGLFGHRPIIRGGARPASRREYLSGTERWPIAQMARGAGLKHLVNRNGSMNWDEVSAIPGLGWTRRFAGGQSRYHHRPSGTAVTIAPQVYLYGTDELVSAAKRQQAKKTKRQREKSK